MTTAATAGIGMVNRALMLLPGFPPGLPSSTARVLRIPLGLLAASWLLPGAAYPDGAATAPRAGPAAAAHDRASECVDAARRAAGDSARKLDGPAPAAGAGRSSSGGAAPGIDVARPYDRADPDPAESSRMSEAYEALRGCLRELLTAGDLEGALVVARGADEIFAAEPQSGFDLGALLLTSGGDPIAARAVLESALGRPGRFTKTAPKERALALNNLGKLALSRKDPKEAKRLLAEALQLDPGSGLLHYNAAAADLALGDAPSCLEHVQKALAAAPDDATRDDYLVAAWAYTRSDRPADAASVLRTAIARMPNASGLHLNLGWSLAMQGRPVDALLEYLYELENGAEGDAYVQEARLQFDDGLSRARATPQFAAAIEGLRSTVAGQRLDPAAILGSVRALEQAGYRHATLDLLRAEALHASSKVAEAEAALRKLLREDPAFLPAYFDLALILRATKRGDEARRLVADAVKRNPAHWQLIGDTVAAPPAPQPAAQPAPPPAKR